MKREIKFRAWGRYGDWNELEDKREWKMIDADCLCFEEFAPICELLEDKEDEEYFMQYTGLKDKNDKEVYESDIIRGLTGYIFIVGFRNGSFGYIPSANHPSKEKFFYACHISTHYDEVIGNVYENPNLLTSDKNDE